MKKVLFAVFLFVLSFANIYAEEGQKAKITQESIDNFIRIYPKYVEIAQKSNLIPSDETIEALGTKMEDGTLDLNSMIPAQNNAEAFRKELEQELAKENMDMQKFSELSAKISVIYSNLSVKNSMELLSDEEKAGLNMYTEQFNMALSAQGITYDKSEEEVINSNLGKLDELFDKVLSEMEG